MATRQEEVARLVRSYMDEGLCKAFVAYLDLLIDGELSKVGLPSGRGRDRVEVLAGIDNTVATYRNMKQQIRTWREEKETEERNP